MDKIYNRIRRLLPVATNNHKQHPKNRAFQISFVGLFVLLLLKSGVWQFLVQRNLPLHWHLHLGVTKTCDHYKQLFTWTG